MADWVLGLLGFGAPPDLSLRSLRHLSADRHRFTQMAVSHLGALVRSWRKRLPALCSPPGLLTLSLSDAVAGLRLESATSRKHNRICVNLRRSADRFLRRTKPEKHNGAAHPSGRNASPPLAYFAFICGPVRDRPGFGAPLDLSLRSLRHLSADQHRCTQMAVRHLRHWFDRGANGCTRFAPKPVIRVASFVQLTRLLAPRIRYAAKVQPHLRKSALICGPFSSPNEARKAQRRRSSVRSKCQPAIGVLRVHLRTGSRPTWFRAPRDLCLRS